MGKSGTLRFLLPVLLGGLLAGCGWLKAPSPPAGTHTGPPASPTSPSRAANGVSPPPYNGPPGSAPVTVSVKGSSPTWALTAVNFVSPRDGWVAGSRVILATHDGGQSWQSVYRGALDLTGIHFVSPQDGWAWSAHTLLGTVNGGRSWTVVSRAAAGYDSLSWVNPEAGFAVVGNPYTATTRLEATTNGGKSWTDLPTPVTPVSVSFANSLDGWMGGLPGWSVYRTTDGGQSWSRSLQVGTAAIQEYGGGTRVTGVSATNAWALLVGYSGMSQTSYSLYRTTDGSTWTAVAAVPTAGAGPAPGNPTQAPHGPGSSPGPLAVVDGSTAYLAGVCNACNMGITTIQRTDNGGSAWTRYPPLFGANGYPGPNALSFPTARDGWLVDSAPGNPGQILVTHDGGRTWTQQFPARLLSPLRGVSFLNARLGYGLGAIGQPNAVLRTTDGGRHWSAAGTLPGPIPSFIGGNWLPPIAFVSRKQGWAVGADGHLWSTTNGGASWRPTTAAPPPPGSIEGVVFVGPRRGCMGAWVSSAQTWRTTDSGRSWVPVPGPLVQCLAALIPPRLGRSLHPFLQSMQAQSLGIAGAGIAWVPAAQDDWWLTADGGRKWVHYRLPAAIDRLGGMANIDFVDSRHGWIVTNTGQLLASTDGGRTWALLP